MTPLLELTRDGVAAAEAGGKFSTLVAVARHLPVPPAVCIPCRTFELALGDDVRQCIDAFFADARATVGSFLLACNDELGSIRSSIVVPQPLATSLVGEIRRVLGDGPFAVRSSAVGEDGAASSYAGVYDSVLDVPPEELPTAIETCWRSYYGERAILARFRTGDVGPAPRMGVIVQQMVPAVLAGVAVTDGEGCVDVEYCDGLADALVAGVGPLRRHRSGTQPEGPDAAALRAVEAIARAAERLLGGAADVEWVWDGNEIAVVQARSVIARQQTTPHLIVADLYDEVLPRDVDLGTCRDVYLSYVAKRRPLHRLARELGVATGRAHVVSFDAAGLLERREALLEELGLPAGSEAVIDAGGLVRQVVLPADQVPGYLEALSATPGRHSAIVRRFIRGELGAITRRVESGEVIVEYSNAGLLAINRGTAGATLAVLGHHTANAPEASLPHPLAAAADTMVRFTEELDRRRVAVQVEWVIEDGIPFFVDFSETQPLTATVLSNRMMSAGTAIGPALVLGDDTLLSRLSVGPAVSIGHSIDVTSHAPLMALLDVIRTRGRPIVVATNPYVVLSTFIDEVAGFVFESGSALCHLALLLREAGVPAAVLDRSVAIKDGTTIAIADGEVRLLNDVPT